MFQLDVCLVGIVWTLGCLLAPASAWPTWPSLPHYKSERPGFVHRNFETISRIYNLTVYPNQLPILGLGGAAVPPGLFNKDAAGRVTPVGNFTGFEHSIEYFFALAPVPQGNAAKAAITGYRIAEFSSGCEDVAASVVYLYCSVVDPGSADHGKPLPALKQIAFWKFDKAGAVLKYDAWIPNLNTWVESTTFASVTDTTFQARSIEAICANTQQRCTGSNTQWTSAAECVASLSKKPYGHYDEAWGDNVVCRSIHLVLTQVHPDVRDPFCFVARMLFAN